MQYGRYGYRRIRRMLVDEGWRVNVKRVWRIWRREGLKVPRKQPNVAACGSMTDRASGFAPSGPITCGPTTSCRIAPRTGGDFAC